MNSRHDLVWLTPAGWDAALAGLPGAERASLLQWRVEDWPAVVRRPDAGIAPDQVALGVALPPVPGSGYKPRVALHAPRAAISRHEAAIPLARAAEAAPPAWRAPLLALAARAPACGLRSYGSLALQAITGLHYLRPSSDIDLLLAPADRTELEEGIVLLSEHAAHLPLDGEIVFPCGAAVAWKEWCAGGARVLAKSISEVRLADRAALLATLGHA
jgi:phosphoribosyl-dephospho-CoA transferase